jgi:tetratricopeptide (TPR) repeat protein
MTLFLDEPAADATPAEAVAEPPVSPLPPRIPAPAERLLERADALAAGPRRASAVEVYRELLAADPGHVEARLHLARLHLSMEEPDAALALLGQALRDAPDQTEYLVLRGGLYARLRLYEEAEADLRRVLRLHPSHAPAHLELGQMLWRKGLAVEAAGHFRRSLEFQPDQAAAYRYLGDALNQAGDLPGARAALERAVLLDARDAKAHHLLGRVLDRLGYPEEAREMYCRARDLAGT